MGCATGCKGVGLRGSEITFLRRLLFGRAFQKIEDDAFENAFALVFPDSRIRTRVRVHSRSRTCTFVAS